MTQIISVTIKNLITTKAGAEHETGILIPSQILDLPQTIFTHGRVLETIYGLNEIRIAVS